MTFKELLDSVRFEDVTPHINFSHTLNNTSNNPLVN